MNRNCPPGDDDYIRTDIIEEVVALTMEQAEVIVAGQHKRDIEAHVKKLVACDYAWHYHPLFCVLVFGDPAS